MEKIINLTDVSDEAFTAIAESIQKWKDAGAIASVGYHSTEETLDFVKRSQRAVAKSYNTGVLWSGLALVACAGVCAAMDYVRKKKGKL